jgi:hypothetical protein
MPRKHVCEFCGREYTTNEAVLEHIKRDHLGKLSESSIEYLLELGVKPNKIIEFCRREKVKVDESKVYKIAVKMVRKLRVES